MGEPPAQMMTANRKTFASRAGLLLGLVMAIAGVFQPAFIAPLAPADLAVHVAHASVDAPIRIMPLGDSITQGLTDSVAYRYSLWNKLVTLGYDVDFVGSQGEGYGTPSSDWTDYDRDHDGHSGIRADQVANNIVTWATAAQPEIVLLHIGTNDLRQGQSAASTVNDIGLIIDRLRQVNASVTVVLAKIIPCDPARATTDCFLTQIAQLNAQLDGLATGKTSASSLVLVADQNAGFNAVTDSSDGIHPTRAGAAKMAEVWLPALQQVMGLPPGATVDDTQTGVSQQQIQFNGNWSVCAGCDPNDTGLFNRGYTFSQTSGNTAEMSFSLPASGRIKVYSAKGAGHGIAAVSVDGGGETDLDLYSPSDRGYAVVWASGVLAAGAHTVRVRVTGRKTSGSSGTRVNIDRFEILGGAVQAATPTQTRTPMRTPSRTPSPTLAISATPTVTRTPIPTPRATQTPHYLPLVSG